MWWADLATYAVLATVRGVPVESARAAVVEEVRDAAAAIDDMRGAAARLDELNCDEDPAEIEMAAMDEFDALWERLDPATDVLARYAEVLRRHLPTIRHDLATAASRR